MLPRVPAWYAAVLGAIRIGAMPMPGPNLLTGRDIAFRMSRSEAVAAITDAAPSASVDSVAADLSALRHRLCWSPAGGAPPGWGDFDALCAQAGDGETPANPTAADDPMLLYFTSGTVAYPKMVLHTQASYGLGHVITARYWQPAPGRPALDRLRHRLGQGRLGRAVRAVARAGHRSAGATGQARCRHHPVNDLSARHHVVLRAPNPLPAAGPSRPHPLRPVRPAALHQRR